MKKKVLIAAVCVIAVAAFGSGSKNSSNAVTKNNKFLRAVPKTKSRMLMIKKNASQTITLLMGLIFLLPITSEMMRPEIGEFL